MRGDSAGDFYEGRVDFAFHSCTICYSARVARIQLLYELCVAKCLLELARSADSSTYDMLVELLWLLALARLATGSFPDAIIQCTFVPSLFFAEDST